MTVGHRKNEKQVTTLPFVPSLQREGEKLSQDNLGMSQKNQTLKFKNKN